MSNEELEIFSTMCKSLNALHKLLSNSSDHLSLNICNKILELDDLLCDEINQSNLQPEEILFKLEEINELLLTMNFRFSFKQMANPTCHIFKTEMEKHIKSLHISTTQNKFEINNMN